MKTFGTWPDGRPFNKTPGQWHREQQEQKAEQNPDAAQARLAGKNDVKAMLRRVAAVGGKQALDFALNLPETMPLDEVERVAMGAVARGALSPQRGTVAAVPAPRMETRQAEADWLRQAQLAAEEQWNRAMGRSTPIRQLTAEEIALNQSFNAIAAKAAGLTHDPDSGQKRWRADAEDAELYRRGQEAAKRIWPGR
jgi:hypothetical protein